MIRLFFLCLASVHLSGCASTPEVIRSSSQTMSEPFDPRAEVESVKDLASAEIPEFDIIPRARPLPEVDPASLPPANAVFDGDYIWAGTKISAGLKAYRASCRKILKRPTDVPFSKKLDIWGLVGDWHPICNQILNSDDAMALRLIASDMEPVRISFKDIKGKFTGYFEPVYEARLRPQGVFTEPILTKPKDLIIRGKTAKQKRANGTTRPYPDRANIDKSGSSIIAYAHPADVFFLQIQGSGRLILENGSTIRAEYAGHNGHPFRSTANWLIRRGHIRRSQASMQGIRKWMDDVGPTLTQRAMNANPRYIFFNEASLGDPTQGPKGATGDPLTPLGSMAVDPKFIPYHLPLIVQTTAPGLGGEWRGLLISQDTGNAIKGPIRGDLYFGTGFEAGDRAGTMNAPGKLWVLLPKTLIQRLEQDAYASIGYELG